MSEEKKPTGYEWLEENSIDKTYWRLPPTGWERKMTDLAEASKYLVEVKVLRIMGRGVCPYGHKPGDTFILDGDSLPMVVKTSAPTSGLCSRAIARVFDFGYMMPGPAGGRGEEDSSISLGACPAALNPVIFQMKRVKKTRQTSKAPWVLKKKE